MSVCLCLSVCLCPKLLSAAEDSLVRVWHLTMTPETNSVEVTSQTIPGRDLTTPRTHRQTDIDCLPPSLSLQIVHMYNECVTDTQICGAKFCDGDGYAFAVTGYDLSEIIRYTQV